MNMRDYDGWDKKPTDWEDEPETLKQELLNHKCVYSFNSSLYKDIKPDAIFVLAGGLTDNGKVHEWVMRRLDLAFHIYNSYKSKDNIKLICLGGGTYHKPPILNEHHYVVHESTECADYLINLGVKPENIYKEWGSYDTVANGFFAYTNFILPMDLKNIFIITSEFHMHRTEAIFRWIINLDKRLHDVKLYFISVSDDGLPEDVISVRRKR